MVKEDTKLDFQLIANLSVDVIFQLTLKSEITYCSPSVEQMLGYKSEEVIGSNFHDFLNPTDISMATEAFQRLISGKIFVNFEFQLLHKDNSAVQVEISAAPVIAQGEVVSIQGICRDISELKQVKQEIRHSEERFRDFIEASPDGIALTDLDGTILLVNNYGATTLGYENKEELIGKNGFDILVSEDREQALKNVPHVLETGRLETTEYSLIKKDGSRFSVDMTVSLIKDAEDNPTSFMVVIRDISERIKMKKVIQESELQTRQIIDNIRDIVFTLSPEGNVTSLNPAFEKITRLTPNEIIGKPFISVIHPDNVSGALKALESILQGELPPTSEVLLKTKEGTYAVVEGRVAPQYDQGKIVGFFGVARDITQRKQAEKALRESEEMFRLLSEQSLMAICLIQDDQIKYVNQTFLELVGSPMEEILSWTSKEYLQFVHPDHRTFVQEQAHKKQIGESEGVVPQYSFRTILPSGEIKWLEVYSKTILYKGRPANFVTFTEITESKRMEEKLRESKERFRSFSDQSLMGICLIQDNKISYANQVFADIVEFPLEEILSWIKDDYLQLLHPTDRSFFREQGQKILAGEIEGVSPHQSFRLIVKSGKIKWIDVYTKNIMYKGSPADFITLIDITDRKQIQKELQESEEKHRYILENIRDIVFTLLSDGTISSLSPEFEKITGWTCDEWIGRPFVEIVHPDDISIEGFQATLSGESPPPYEGRIISKSGEIVIFEVKATPQIKEGKSIGYLGICRDITERKKAEEELIRTKKRLEYLLKSCPAVIYSCTPDGHFETTFMSENIKDILGHQADNFIKKPEFWEGNIHPEDRERAITSFREIAEKGYYSGAYRFKHKDSSYRWMLEEANLIHDDNGNPLEIVGFWTDITERKTVEEKFRSIFENTPIGMALTDLDFRFRKLNRAFCEMIGHSEQKLMDLSLYDITHPEDRRNDIKFAKNVAKNEKSIYQTRKRYLKKDEDPFWARTTLSHLHNDKGEPINYLVMIEDITARMQLEEGWKQQLLKYDVTDGNIYLVQENTPAFSQTVFVDLIEVGYMGFIISRTPERDYNISKKETVTFHQLTETKDNETLSKILEETPDKSVILIDRMDYLITNKGFENTMQFIYKLAETAYLKNSIVILSVDHVALEEKQLHILEKETKEIELRSLATLSEENLVIMRLIYQQNNLGIKPSYSDIGQELKISRPTARKRIKNLVTTGYLIDHKIGNSKVVELTEKGRFLFMR
ncbi:MAG: PAS domain S-box protein [Candidatus Heimdallarchaeota archaeon]|nr:MAG: PAS domain S-box protein [Candidatus Heimdallarchaeota archaeon]